MNVGTVQNNNSQSFGMSLKLKGDSAKRLATIMEETNKEYGTKIMSTLKNIKNLKSKVVCDGEMVTVQGPGMSVSEVLDNSHRAPHTIVAKLFTAHDMGKYLDKVAAQKAYAREAYGLQAAASKQANIEAKAKELMDLFG